MPIWHQRRSYVFPVTWLLLGAVSAIAISASCGAQAEAAAKRRLVRHFETCDDRILSRQRVTQKSLRRHWWLTRHCQQGTSGPGEDARHDWSSPQEDAGSGDDGTGDADHGDHGEPDHHGDEAGGQDNNGGADGNTGDGQGNDNAGAESEGGNKGGASSGADSGADSGGGSGKGKGGGSKP